MSAIDTARAVLAKASLADQTFATPDLGIAAMWAEALGDINRDDALQAVTTHYAEQTRRLMPADVRRGVQAIRARRLEVNFEDIPELDAVADDPIAYQRVLREQRDRVASGEIVTRPEKPNVRAAEAVRELAERTAEKLPRIPRMTLDVPATVRHQPKEHR